MSVSALTSTMQSLDVNEMSQAHLSHIHTKPSTSPVDPTKINLQMKLKVAISSIIKK